MLGVQPRVLHIKVRTDRHGNGRWRKDELDQGGHACDQSAFFAKGTTAVGERTAGVRDGGGELGKTENETGVHGGNHQGCYQKAQRTRNAPAVAPAEVFAGNHQPYRDPP